MRESLYISVVNRHRFDADPDLDPNFGIKMMQILMRTLPHVSHVLKNQNFFLLLVKLCQFTMLYLSHQCQKVIMLSILNSILIFFGNKVQFININFFICLAGIDTDPDPE